MPIGVPKSGKRKSHQRVDRVELVCAACGKTRVMLPCQRRQRKSFCSRECYVEARRASKKPIELVVKRAIQKVRVICAMCGSECHKWPSQIRSKLLFCSVRCSSDHKRRGFDLKAWRQKNRDRINQRSREWRAANRDKVAAIAAVRRTAEKSRASTSEVLALIGRANGRCVYCGKQASRYQIDHIDPVASGGTSEIENLMPACAACNRSKGAKEVSEWLYDAHGAVGLARALVFMERREMIF